MTNSDEWTVIKIRREAAHRCFMRSLKKVETQDHSEHQLSWQLQLQRNDLEALKNDLRLYVSLLLAETEHIYKALDENLKQKQELYNKAK